MKILIIAAGDGTRWNNFLGVPKHLAPLCGERLLDRTVRLLKKFAPSAQVRVVLEDPRDPAYNCGARNVRAKLDPGNGEADKFLSSRHLWAKDERTIVLYGDVFFTEHAIQTIVAEHGEPWLATGRINGSEITGTLGGELFAFSILPDAHPLFDDALAELVEAHRSGHWRAGGWELYRTLCGVDLMDHADHGHFVEVDDWTEDMDEPRDWDEWCLRWALARGPKPEVHQ